MHALTFEQALWKYRPDQSRDERGRFADEGRASGRDDSGTLYSRKPKGTTTTGTRKPRAPKAPGTGAIRAARKPKPTAGEVRDAFKEASDAFAVKDPENKQQLERAAQAGRDIERTMRTWSRDVWAKPDVIDEAFKALTSWNVTMAALLSGPFTAGVSTALYGGAISLAGVYFAIRYLYRKVKTGGAYRGVRPERWMADDDSRFGRY